MSKTEWQKRVSERADEARRLVDDAHAALRDIDAIIQEGPISADEDTLDEIKARLQRGDLSEAVILIGRLHPALADLPHAFERRA